MIPLILLFLTYTAMVVVTPFIAIPLINKVLSSPYLLGFEPLPTLDAGPVTEATVEWLAETSVCLRRAWHMAVMGWRGETPTPPIIISLTRIYIDSESVSWNHLDPLEQLGRTLLIVIAVLLMMLFALLVISVHSIVCNRTPSKVPSKVAIQRHAHSHITTTAAATTIATISASIPDMPLTSPITETATTPTETPEEETDAGASFGGGDFSTPRPTSDSYSSNPFTVAAAVAAVSAIPDIPLMGHVAETAIIPTETSEEETEAGAFFGGDDFSTPRPTSDSYSSNPFTTVADRMPDILMSPVAGPATIPIETSEEETEADASFGGGDFSTPRSASDSIAGTAITDAIPSNTSKEVTIARSSSQKCPGYVFSPRSSTAAVSMSSVFSNLTNVGYVGKERSARSTSSGGLRHPAMVVSGGVGREGMLFNTADDPVDLTYGFRDAQIDEPSSRPRQGHVGGLIASGLWGRR